MKTSTAFSSRPDLETALNKDIKQTKKRAWCPAWFDLDIFHRELQRPQASRTPR